MHADLPIAARARLRSAGFVMDFMRYALCGVIAVAVDYGVFGALTRALDWGAVAAQSVSRPCGGVVSFILNRMWTFRGRGSAAAHVQALRFALVWIAMYGWSLVLVWLFDRLLRDAGVGLFLARWLAKLGGDGIAALTGFTANRFWTFGGRRASASDADAPSPRA